MASKFYWPGLSSSKEIVDAMVSNSMWSKIKPKRSAKAKRPEGNQDERRTETNSTRIGRPIRQRQDGNEITTIGLDELLRRFRESQPKQP